MMQLKGQLFGQYRFQKLLKKGGMAEVYLANDERLHRRVAIKVIWTDPSHYDDIDKAHEAIRLFLREARTLASFDHQHILPVFGSGEGKILGVSFMYLVMPYREEGSLSDWLHNNSDIRPLSIWDIDRILQQAASALQYAHDMNIIHQDIKSSNFLIHGKTQFPSQLELQLADFGIAKFMTTTSKSQEIRGTPRYMAPEQWDNHPLPATDQYALAVMIYELLTGQPPFSGDTHEQLWHQHCHVQPPSPSSMNALVPRSLDSVILKALAKQPEQRFASVTDFARAFRQAILNSNHKSRANEREDEVVSLASVATLEKTVPVDYPPNLSPPPIPPPDIPPRHIQGKMLIFLGLVLLLIGGSSGILYTVRLSNQISILPSSVTNVAQGKSSTALTKIAFSHVTNTAQTSGTTSAQAGETSTAQTAIANTTATQTVINLTRTAEANATNTTSTQIAGATATIIAYSTAVPNGYVLLQDPLQDNSLNYNWDSTNFPDGSNCTFTAQAYHAMVGTMRTIQYCFAQNTDFTDFSCQVNIDIITGHEGGIAFRGNEMQDTYYYFHISTNGTYGLDIYNGDTPSSHPLASGSNLTIIHPNANGTNSYVLAIVAIGSTFLLFVNGSQIASVTDNQNTYSHGEIGFVASTQNAGNPTDVAFTSAEVWQR